MSRPNLEIVIKFEPTSNYFVAWTTDEPPVRVGQGMNEKAALMNAAQYGYEPKKVELTDDQI